jgi:hypothetical protein
MSDRGDQWQGVGPTDGDAEYEMVWRFINQSPDFVFGVEAGIINEQMNRREQTITRAVHVEQEEELRNLANSLGYSSHFESLGDAQTAETWAVATFTRSPVTE